MVGFPAAWVHGAVMLGDDAVATNGFAPLLGRRIGLITNPSGVNGHLESMVDVLRMAKGVKLTALFGAEHGVYGDIPAGQEFTNRLDRRTQLPIYSLYGPGPTRKPTPAMLKGLDALVYDLQDTGCRSYTFISTMGQAMEACGEAGVEFIVLDRPNPLGGERVEGPRLDPRFRSFVGRWDVPYVYGLTCGELARMINGEKWISHPCKLTVIPLQGWRRSMVWRDTGLAWIPTSPHVPHGDSPLYQVATGLLGEIGGLSTGIGYTLPFQCLAAPWLEADSMAKLMNGYGIRGVHFVPLRYTPFYGAYKGQLISGVEIIWTEPAQAPLMALNFYALGAVKRLAGRDLLSEAVNSGKNFAMFDKVNGTDATRRALLRGASVADLRAAWKAGEDDFRQKRRPYLLYP